MQKQLSGLIPAPYTPMKKDGSLHLSVIEQQAEALISSGVNGAFICGTNGEGLSLTIDERMKVAERWQSVVNAHLPVIVHVGHTCLADSKILAVHAQKIGAFAIATIGPCYFKPERIEDLVAYCVEIAATAPEFPFYYYHIPSMSGVALPMFDFLKVAVECVPNLAGVKFSHGDLMDFGQCVHLDDGRFNMLFGSDENLLAAVALGTDGAVGSTYNFAASLYHRLLKAYEAGDMTTARMEQAQSRRFITALKKFGGVVSGKAVMKMIGIDCGPVRLPLRNLTSEQYESLYTELEKIGFFDIIS